MKITVERLQPEEIEGRGIHSWPIWEKEVSRFDWHYDQIEECLLLEGDVEVQTTEGTVHFGKGDFVTFPKGLSCVWNIRQAVRKHYNFR